MARAVEETDMLKQRIWSLTIAVWASLIIIILGGCASTEPSNFYVLSPVQAIANGPDAGRSLPGVTIGVGPIEIAQYLDRPQMVSRSSQNELILAEFDKWAEPLKDNIGRVLAENLSGLLSTDRVFVFPWRHSGLIDYQAVVRITRFDTDWLEETKLVARWKILGENGDLLVMRKSEYRASGKEGYRAIAEAMSQNLADLSRDIAAAIQALEK